MSYRVEFLDEALKQLRSLPRAVQRTIAVRIDALSDNPRPPTARPLQGELRGRWRIRVGDYRVVYAIEDEILLVIVIEVGHRRDIYERVRRRRR